MRPVAGLFALMFLVAAMPATADHATYDECANSATAPNACLRLESPTGAGPTRTFYAWAASAKCAPTFDAPCAGRPTADHPTVPSVGFAGVLYEDTNNLGGLQRARLLIGAQRYDPDAVLLT